MLCLYVTYVYVQIYIYIYIICICTNIWYIYIYIYYDMCNCRYRIMTYNICEYVYYNVYLPRSATARREKSKAWVGCVWDARMASSNGGLKGIVSNFFTWPHDNACWIWCRMQLALWHLCRNLSQSRRNGADSINLMSISMQQVCHTWRTNCWLILRILVVFMEHMPARPGAFCSFWWSWWITSFAHCFQRISEGWIEAVWMCCLWCWPCLHCQIHRREISIACNIGKRISFTFFYVV